jgi:hypothetical protein
MLRSYLLKHKRINRRVFNLIRLIPFQLFIYLELAKIIMYVFLNPYTNPLILNSLKVIIIP